MIINFKKTRKSFYSFDTIQPCHRQSHHPLIIWGPTPQLVYNCEYKETIRKPKHLVDFCLQCQLSCEFSYERQRAMVFHFNEQYNCSDPLMTLENTNVLGFFSEFSFLSATQLPSVY